MLPGNLQYRYIDLYFTTATIKGWKHLLRPNKYKKIITESLAFLVKEKCVNDRIFLILKKNELVKQPLGL